MGWGEEAVTRSRRDGRCTTELSNWVLSVADRTVLWVAARRASTLGTSQLHWAEAIPARNPGSGSGLLSFGAESYEEW